MTSPEALNQCSALGCNAQAVATANFFTNPQVPDLGIQFQFCKPHRAYWEMLITISDMCQRQIIDMGKWVFAMPPPFTQFKEAIEKQEAAQQKT